LQPTPLDSSLNAIPNINDFKSSRFFVTHVHSINKLV
jgi:hypothetical protein